MAFLLPPPPPPLLHLLLNFLCQQDVVERTECVVMFTVTYYMTSPLWPTVQLQQVNTTRYTVCMQANFFICSSSANTTQDSSSRQLLPDFAVIKLSHRCLPTCLQAPLEPCCKELWCYPDTPPPLFFFAVQSWPLHREKL